MPIWLVPQIIGIGEQIDISLSYKGFPKNYVNERNYGLPVLSAPATISFNNMFAGSRRLQHAIFEIFADGV